MADLVSGRSSFIESAVEWIIRRHGSESLVIDHYPVGRSRSAGKLRISQQTATKITDPDVQHACSVQGIASSLTRFFYSIVGSERRDGGRFSHHLRKIKSYIAIRHAVIIVAGEVHTCIRQLCVCPVEVMVQNINLR